MYDKSKNEESFLKDISFNDSIIYEKFDKKNTSDEQQYE